jgi:hypothetical protein
MLEQMWAILTTFSEESQKAALLKCAELGLDTNRGIVSLDESFINLNAARHILMDAIEQKKLIQLPLTVQKNILSNLDAISKNQTNLIAGTDEVVNLANAIENLNTSIWQYGLHNLSNEVLGYQTKLNQLKALEIEARDLNRSLQEGMEIKEQLARILIDAGNQSGELQQYVGSANGAATKVNEVLASATDASQKSSAVLSTIQQNETVSTQLLAATNKSSAEITALEKRIIEFYGNIDEYKKKITDASDMAKNTVDANNVAANKLITDLDGLEAQIKAQIQKATGYSLFHSFQTRQESLSKSKLRWIYALAALILATMGLTVFVIYTTDTTTTNYLNAAFFLKLSIVIPLTFAITFCSVQYSRERRLEEEYAFKSNISISLVPYQELVERLVAKDHADERQKYASFIIDSITKVFSSPTEKIFDRDGKQHNESSEGTIKQMGATIKTVVETVAKAVK